MSEDDDVDDEELMTAPDPSITREEFLAWRSPRVGTQNPECMTNPVWTWLVRSRADAFHATKIFDGPSALDAGPGWCFQRFGQSTTRLPDGRIVQIAGEHEDFYDPDFYIYNDVVVRHPDGGVEIFGYPREVFPPTDFHSATLAGDRIILVGSLGYPQDRKPAHTQVLALDVATWSVSSVVTHGECPGWIHSHTADLDEDGSSILIRGGKIDRESTLVENLDDWRLHLAGWRWERLTRRDWPRWEYRRADGRRHHLWEIEQALWYRSVGWDEDLKKSLEELERELGKVPDLDAVEGVFRPPVPHEILPREEYEHSVRRCMVEGVTVRYAYGDSAPQLTVEGVLSPEVAEALSNRFLDALSEIENARFVRVSL